MPVPSGARSTAIVHLSVFSRGSGLIIAPTMNARRTLRRNESLRHAPHPGRLTTQKASFGEGGCALALTWSEQAKTESVTTSLPNLTSLRRYLAHRK
jgi:hypothetical protein